MIELLVCAGNERVVNKTGKFYALKEFNIPGVEDGQFLRGSTRLLQLVISTLKKKKKKAHVDNGIATD